MLHLSYLSYTNNHKPNNLIIGHIILIYRTIIIKKYIFNGCQSFTQSIIFNRGMLLIRTFESRKINKFCHTINLDFCDIDKNKWQHFLQEYNEQKCHISSDMQPIVMIVCILY